METVENLISQLAESLQGRNALIQVQVGDTYFIRKIGDVNKLLESFNALIDNGHSVIIIEHNLEVIKSADWVIDLGPESGDKGGEIVCEGTPEDIVKCRASYTGKALKDKL